MEREQLLAAIGSFLGLLAFLKSVIPSETWSLLEAFFQRAISWASGFTHVDIPEFDGGFSNELYQQAELHVATLAQPVTEPRKQRTGTSSRRLVATRLKHAAKCRFLLANGECIADTFQEACFLWSHKSKPRDQIFYSIDDVYSDSTRAYRLSVRRDAESLLSSYLEHVSSRAKDLEHQLRVKLLYTNAAKDGVKWVSIPLEHPASFDSMAMDPELKCKMMEDLKAFMSDSKFYRGAGRAWKRGYLLHGPPGTGKSSLIAAMANFTGYNIYDLELTAVSSNAELRKLLLSISGKSIIVIEDIDCSLNLQKRGEPDESDSDADDEKSKKNKKKTNRVTLSGLLNFTDGLWSCCGNERIIVFTTNFIDKIDPALLRTGRMDLHIEMSYLTFEGFKVLARTHLGVVTGDDGGKFGEIEKLLSLQGTEITPSDAAEVLIQHKSDTQVALKAVVSELEKRKAR